MRVITFRRRNPDDIIVTSEADTAFIYDPSNDQTLDCNWAEVNSTMEGHDHEHKVATGTLRKVYGYEYRVVALAYSSSRTFADIEGLRCSRWGRGECIQLQSFGRIAIPRFQGNGEYL